MTTRFERLYEIACIYTDLVWRDRYLLATHFQLVGVKEIGLPPDEMDVIVLKRVMEKDIYDDFKRFAHAYQAGKFRSDTDWNHH